MRNGCAPSLRTRLVCHVRHANLISHACLDPCSFPLFRVKPTNAVHDKKCKENPSETTTDLYISTFLGFLLAFFASRLVGRASGAGLRPTNLPSIFLFFLCALTVRLIICVVYLAVTRATIRHMSNVRQRLHPPSGLHRVAKSCLGELTFSTVCNSCSTKKM